MQGGQEWQQLLQMARAEAQLGHFDAFRRTCREIVGDQSNNLNALLDVGSLLLSYGFLSDARNSFYRATSLAPTDLRAMFNLANIAQQAGDHAECRRLYASLLEQLPDHPVIRRNALLSLEYCPGVSDAERVAQAKAWGRWAMTRAGGPFQRPSMRPLDGRPLRVGYVSADFCQHTVGLFVKDVLAAHDRSRVTPYAYSAGHGNDWVTAIVRDACVFRDVHALNDVALASQIRQDQIDVLVDLSGHTAGSRLTMFAYRPAPLQVSWLGYFATTGLSAIDAILLDEWHAPPGVESQFVERIVRLPGGRFCYTPVPFAPADVAPSPYTVCGYVTFGSFNNTAKLNADVIGVWARVLAAVPNSRLILKWRTFDDEQMRVRVDDMFAKHDIDPERIEMRGASFHADLLKEYADIDICLDTFPFTGGLTSCEALWMGVPLVTWPQSRVVSRQTYAFLKAIGIEELAVTSTDEYVRKAVELANNPERLHGIRRGMRSLMRKSPLCNVTGFTLGFEHALWSLAQEAGGRIA